MTSHKGIRGWPKGKKHKPETIEKMRIAHAGKGHTEATRAKMSAMRAGAERPDISAGLLRRKYFGDGASK
jgi:hypothetical protein